MDTPSTMSSNAGSLPEWHVSAIKGWRFQAKTLPTRLPLVAIKTTILTVQNATWRIASDHLRKRQVSPTLVKVSEWTRLNCLGHDTVQQPATSCWPLPADKSLPSFKLVHTISWYLKYDFVPSSVVAFSLPRDWTCQQWAIFTPMAQTKFPNREGETWVTAAHW